MTRFIAHLPLVIFSFSEKLSSFPLAANARFILHYSHLCSHLIQEKINANLTFAVNGYVVLIRDVKNYANGSLLPVGEGARCVTSPKNGCEEDYANGKRRK